MRYAKNRPKRAVFLHEWIDALICVKKRPFRDRCEDLCLVCGILSMDKIKATTEILIGTRFVLQYNFKIIQFIQL